MKTKKFVEWTEHKPWYFVREGVKDKVIYNDGARYDFTEDCWVESLGTFGAYVFLSNEADHISEEEARELVESRGGTNFDKQDEMLVFTENKGEKDRG